ncbi:MAG: hypothetical protein A2070_13120 [Bdellovibrionales bacterium GWC1_52_8]|nr:MAG: hypothetical protein A2Z97_03640 [Bdellovibrionales bacterium GWB1_52_6]OFZ02946.1 MAG: hypothetical protein A2X97_05070 [Bdellovibrionales bacterium GWA1_52_35]OFZ33739.1 MAG: hypothetical protein A2070_13120 [Bdellovibrionales bacterium GWC1_52_8]HCM38531.1 hypothetical protein [Bdellovibrionales bacterium]
MTDKVTNKKPPSLTHALKTSHKLGRVAFVMDDRLSREKIALLNRNVHAMRNFAEIELLPGTILEDELLKKLEATPFQLVMAPWYRYLAWSRVEALYGLTRTSGPTFAGYHCEPLLAYELGEQADHLRAILFDFGASFPREMITLLRSLIQDTKRSGILPLLETRTPVYCEHWFGSQGLGARMDTVMSLPEIASYDWTGRANAIRICLTALWSLIYEEGPGKSDTASKTPKASFQIGIDANSLVLRLSYCLPSSSPKDLLSRFWPKTDQPSAPAQLLLKYSDFLRVHHVAEGYLVEVVVGFLKSAPSEVSHPNVHTLWIEPLAPNLLHEPPFDLPGPTAPHLKLLPSVPILKTAEAPSASSIEELRAKERFITEANEKIRGLRSLVNERDTLIHNLRSGGVGTAPPLPPPDAENLLDAFQDKFFEARYLIRNFELRIAELETEGSSQTEIELLRRKMEELLQRQNEWIKKIAKTIQGYKESRTRK